MKFKIGDMVLVTAGKDKGKRGKVVRVLPELEKVVVENMNIYVKHVKPMNGKAGERLELPRPLPTAKVAILTPDGKADRIGYKVNKDGSKDRIYKKTGKVIETQVAAPKAKAKK